MTAGRWASWLGVAVVVVVALGLGVRATGATTLAERATDLADDLRCPVCQGLSVADSDSETSRQIRADIEKRIADGQTDGEIRQAYVDRYGEWILLRPSRGGLGSLLWLAPLVAIALAAAGLAVAGRRWRRAWGRPATQEERELVRRALRESGQRA